MPFILFRTLQLYLGFIHNHLGLNQQEVVTNQKVFNIFFLRGFCKPNPCLYYKLLPLFILPYIK